MPEDMKPACKADSNIYPEMRVSFPMRTLVIPSSFRTEPAAQPNFVTNKGFMVEVTGPLIPSVPNFRSFLRADNSFFLRGATLLMQ